MITTSNTLLKLLALGLALLAVLALLWCGGDSSALQPADPGAPAAAGVAPTKIDTAERERLAADGDTARDTVATLIAEVKALKRDVEVLTAANQRLRQENADLNSLEHKIQARIDARASAQAEQADQRSQAMEARLSDAQQSLATLQERLRSVTVPKGSIGTDIPVGLGLRTAQGDGDVLRWVEPLDGALPQDRKAPPSATTARVQPRYTINRDATLIGSVALTALIGRIPVGSQVQDPYPFKILVGADNLAANGLRIPGLEAMVMSGTATGDWALSCVRGEITSATFVFQDGMIRSYPAPGAGDGSRKAGSSFGYLSDPYGMPCIGGERRTNAVQYLGTRVGLAAAKAAAEAAAAAQTSTVVSGQSGTVTSAVTGSPGAFARQKAIASGLDESAQWIRERQGQSFDAVVVPGGTAVAVHIDAEIAIDYDPEGRRVHHVSPLRSTWTEATLD